MLRFSRIAIAVINGLSICLSLVILLLGLWIAAVGHSRCTNFLRWPMIGFGAFFLLLSVAGFIGSCFRRNLLLIAYRVCLGMFIVLLFAVTILLIVSHKYSRNRLSETEELQLSTYQSSLVKLVNDAATWRTLSSCISESQICYEYSGGRDLYQKTVPAIKRGCCRPPSDCGYTYVNSSYWQKTGGNRSGNPDCSRWENGQENMCYRCDTCKASVLAVLAVNLRKLSIGHAIVLFSVILVFILGCFELRNNRQYSKHKLLLRTALAAPSP